MNDNLADVSDDLEMLEAEIEAKQERKKRFKLAVS